MPSLDLQAQPPQLHALALGFGALHDRVRDLSYSPGTDALHRITPLLLKAQELTAAALGHLTVLDNSAYTSLPGSQAGLEALSATVVGASLACIRPRRGHLHQSVRGCALPRASWRRCPGPRGTPR
ncbi:hypothetical protein RB200_23115 [Streptomyces sp. PmtG]